MIIKTNKPESRLLCHRTDLPKEFLRKRKTACAKYNKQHQQIGGADDGCSSSSL